MLHFRLLLLAVFAYQGYGADNKDNVKPKSLPLTPENRYSSGIFDFQFLNPQQPSDQVQFNFVDPSGAVAVPRYQPQFVYYGGGPGQPFLVNPVAPPNNFLYPQPGEPQGPGIIYRTGPQPGRPVFFGPGAGVGGFPNQRPAFTPPVEKDAEEVPTIPSRIPPFNPKKSTGKPEKLETFNEKPNATEADGPNDTENPQKQPNIPKINPVFTKPGHRYFVLNGQPLFSYPFSLYQPQNINPEDVLKFSQNFPQTRPQQVPVPVIPALQNPAFQNPQLQNPTFQSTDIQSDFPNAAALGVNSEQNAVNSFPLYDPYYQGIQNGFFQSNPEQLRQSLHDEPSSFLQERLSAASPQQSSQNTAASPNSHEVPLSNTPQTAGVVKELPISADIIKHNTENQQNVQTSTDAFRKIIPLSVIPNEGQNVKIRVSTKDFNLQPITSRQTGYSQYPEGTENDSVIIDAKYEDDSKDNEAVSTPAKQPREPSLAQAAPGAIALAGPGGVAEAGPKGTAFAGKEGMAVANPRATAIAGPAEEETNVEDKDPKKNTNKEKSEKYIKQRFRGRYQ